MADREGMPADHDFTTMSPAWQRHRAARTTAHHAHDAVDLAELLDMLGLTAAEGREPPEEQPVPVPEPRKPAPQLDPTSACRLNNLFRTNSPERSGGPSQRT